MQFAIDETGQRIRAVPGASGICPICSEQLRTRCGSLRVWHWGHQSVRDCDPWWESETEWHKTWKDRSPTELTEISYGEHRADIVGREGVVIELQNSIISREEVEARENHYGRMVWVLNGNAFPGQFRVMLSPKTATFVWAHPRRSWLFARMPKFIHGFSIGEIIRRPNPITGKLELHWKEHRTSDDLFQILTISAGRSVEGSGRIVTLERFCDKMIESAVSLERQS